MQPEFGMATLGQLHCRVLEGLVPTWGPPGGGFHIWSTKKPESICSTQELVIDLLAGVTLSIGRDSTPKYNHIWLDHPSVSRIHFEIYSVVYDETSHMAMVYVRDHQSMTGTSVNGHAINSAARRPSPGFLLSDGDVITVGPYWEFRVRLFGLQSTPLQGIQDTEARLFRDRYIITDRILGIGSQGTVHLAFDVERRKQVVCKIINLDLLPNHKQGLGAARQLLQRHLRETDILAKVRHPSILAYEHAFRSAHTIYIFTELASGGDLFSKTYISDGLHEENIKFVMYQVVKGIKYLHNKLGLAHRDLKPENIFLASGPNIETRVILGDFGHAKATTWGRMMSTVGTDLYQAPELHSIIDGNLTHGRPVDIWAIGMIILSTIMPGTTLSRFVTTSQVEIDRELDSAFDQPTLNSILSLEGQDFVRRCLQVKPSLRMTASQARKHEWLRVKKRYRDKWKAIRNSLWAPAHTISPCIESLPDVAKLGRQQPQPAARTHIHASSNSASVKLHVKRRIEDIEEDIGPKNSPYFSALENVVREELPEEHKKFKTVSFTPRTPEV